MTGAIYKKHIGALLALLLVGACTVNPATGKKEFTPFMTPSQEAAIGAREHPKLVAEFGGKYEDQALAAYVEEVGDRLAAASEMPGTDFSFTLLNSPIVNAFALPGGYVHISRGLMAYFSDEAEMASVLGHEIGHITARHAANRYTKSIFYGGLAAGAGWLIKNQDLASLVGGGAQLYLLSYSRKQESQSDELGLRYMLRTTHDPMGSVRMLEALQTTAAYEAQKQGRAADQTPNLFRTHPLTSKRIEDQQTRIDALDPQPTIRNRNRDRYLDAIDGMMFGDDPAQGVIRGDDFLHKGFRLAFTAPSGFALMNTASVVVGLGPDDVRFFFTGGEISPNTTNRFYLDQAWASLFEGDPPAPLGNIRTLSSRGMDGITGIARLTSEGGELDIRLVAWRYDGAHAYHFVLITPAAKTSKYAPRLGQMTGSFRKLSASEAAAIRSLRIRVITVQPGDTVSSLAGRMEVWEYREELFRALNGLGDGETLTSGQRVKIVVEG